MPTVPRYKQMVQPDVSGTLVPANLPATTGLQNVRADQSGAIQADAISSLGATVGQSAERLAAVAKKRQEQIAAMEVMGAQRELEDAARNQWLTGWQATRGREAVGVTGAIKEWFGPEIDRLSSGLQSQQAKSAFLSLANSIYGQYADKGATHEAQQVEAWKGTEIDNSFASTERAVRDYAAAGDVLSAQSAIDKHIGYMEIVKPENAETMSRTQVPKLWESWYEEFVGSNDNISREDIEGAEGILAGVVPAERLSSIRRAVQSRQREEAARVEAENAKEAKRVQGVNENKLLSNYLNGKSYSFDQITEMVNAGQIGDTFGRQLQFHIASENKKAAKGESAKDDPDDYIAAHSLVNSVDIHDQKAMDNAKNLISFSYDLKPTTRKMFLDDLAGETSPAWKEASKLLWVMVDGRGEFDPKADPELKRNFAQADAEFRELVRGGTIPFEALRIVAPKYMEARINKEIKALELEDSKASPYVSMSVSELQGVIKDMNNKLESATRHKEKNDIRGDMVYPKRILALRTEFDQRMKALSR